MDNIPIPVVQHYYKIWLHDKQQNSLNANIISNKLSSELVGKKPYWVKTLFRKILHYHEAQQSAKVQIRGNNNRKWSLLQKRSRTFKNILNKRDLIQKRLDLIEQSNVMNFRDRTLTQF